MTAKLIKSILVTVLAVTLTCGLATAGEKMKAYEMGETGQVVLFPMTPQEIAAEAALLAAIKRSEIEAPMVKTFELAESGETITFPMSAEEIRAAKAAMTEVKSVQAEQTDAAVAEYELAESGCIICFPKKRLSKD